MTMKVFRQETNGVTYADPSDPNYSVRFKNTSATKSIDGHRVTNSVQEIIINDDYPLAIGEDTVTDPVSVRVRVSGALESHDRKVAILSALASQLGTWGDENVLEGFNPDTAPISPGSV